MFYIFLFMFTHPYRYIATRKFINKSSFNAFSFSFQNGINIKVFLGNLIYFVPLYCIIILSIYILCVFSIKDIHSTPLFSLSNFTLTLILSWFLNVFSLKSYMYKYQLWSFSYSMLSDFFIKLLTSSSIMICEFLLL